jgi:hypothetical protein
MGLDRGLGVAIDKMGPSIAMLPSSEQAAVAFAEVQSFIRFFVAELGDGALPELIRAIKSQEGSGGLARAIEASSGTDFAGWDKRWREHLTHVPRDLPPDLAPGAAFPHVREVSRGLRLGELLQERGHASAASVEFGKAHALAPFEAMIRAYFAESLLYDKNPNDAAELVGDAAKIHGNVGRWWSLNGRLALQEEDAKQRAFDIAVAHDPLDPWVGCQELAPPEKPTDPLRAALCDAARKAPH